MKSYNNLFNKMLSDEAIEIAIKNATKNKHTQVYIMPYLENRKNTFESARTWLTKYQTIKHRPNCKRRISGYQRRVNKEVSNVVRTAMCGC